MPKVFSTDLRLYATVYIVADSEEEAAKIAASLAGDTLEMPEDRYADLPIYGGSFHADMPEVSLSPAMTIAPAEEQEIIIDEGDELEPSDEDDEDEEEPE